MLENLRPRERQHLPISRQARADDDWSADAGLWTRFVRLLLWHRSPTHVFHKSLLPEEAIATIKRFGGTVECNNARPERPVVAIALSGSHWPDAVLVHIRQCRQIARLDLSKTNVTDSGLAHLSGLSDLKEVRLSHTRVSDAGFGLPSSTPAAPHRGFLEDEGDRRRPGSSGSVDGTPGVDSRRRASHGRRLSPSFRAGASARVEPCQHRGHRRRHAVSCAG